MDLKKSSRKIDMEDVARVIGEARRRGMRLDFWRRDEGHLAKGVDFYSELKAAGEAEILAYAKASMVSPGETIKRARIKNDQTHHPSYVTVDYVCEDDLDPLTVVRNNFNGLEGWNAYEGKAYSVFEISNTEFRSPSGVSIGRDYNIDVTTNFNPDSAIAGELGTAGMTQATRFRRSFRDFVMGF